MTLRLNCDEGCGTITDFDMRITLNHTHSDDLEITYLHNGEDHFVKEHGLVRRV